MNTQPHFEHSPEDLAAQRAAALEGLDVRFMQFDTTYDVNNDAARAVRRNFAAALPRDLTETEVEALTVRVGQVYEDDSTDTRTQVRFLKWLIDATAASDRGSAADATTAASAETVLRHSLGVRGKLGALSMRFSRLVSH